MSTNEIFTEFIKGMKETTLPEYIAVFTGIASVWFSRLENIWVYPVGLVSTIIYVYISMKGSLMGEASVNFYYTVMSIYGWILWAKKDRQQHHILHITTATKKEWIQHLLFFMLFYLLLFFALTYLKKGIFFLTIDKKRFLLSTPGAIPWADAFASATAYTGMWLMAKKKVESWYWWIATNIASIPLYFVKHYVFTSVLYAVLLVMAFFGLFEWIKRAKQQYATV